MKDIWVDIDSFTIQVKDSDEWEDISEKILKYLKSDEVGFSYEEVDDND